MNESKPVDKRTMRDFLESKDIEQEIKLTTQEVQEQPKVYAGHPEFIKIIEQMRDLHIRKSTDYSSSQDILANLKASAEFGVSPWIATIIRMNDKMTRIKSFLEKGELKCESLEDSLIDIGNYAILALILFREEVAAIIETTKP